ncbi:MAG: PAS domain-containing sensor histidine kinase [Calditrichae bacterium]|nr:PAS domain-containing sensor histidine kinase [Calditrichota bacterium]MCB9059264.1 PAS domain-containing sensor histidine kinase [Calditrichia bacterium]
MKQKKSAREQKNVTTNQRQDYLATVTILEHLSDSVFILNNKGIIEYANRSALDMLGMDQSRVLQRHLADFISTQNGSENVFNIALSGNNTEVETEFTAKNFNIPVLINFGTVRDHDGGIRFIIASARDIAWRKEMERVLSQKQILEMSKNRFREMGELTINIVHNLSQPLTSLRLKLDLLQKELNAVNTDKSKSLAHIEKMDQLLDVIDATVNNARSFATQTEDESFKIIRIKDSIANAMHQLSYEFTENNIEISSELGQGEPMVMANPITLQQVFVTLFRMQMKYLSAESAVTAKRKIVISMADNQSKWLGILITAHCEAGKDEIPRVKESHIEETFDFDLNVVKLIAESLGGDFNWYPQASSGFIFSIRIPIDSDDERAQLRNMIELFHDV